MGVNGGNGGHIETSGFNLDIANTKINVSSLPEFKMANGCLILMIIL